MKKEIDYLRYIYFSLIPVLICIIIFILPSSFQELLIFSKSTFNFYNWFTYIFVHENLMHLAGNMIIYSMAIILGFIIIPKAERKNVTISAYLILILIPFISLLSSFILTPYLQGYSRGFSGVSSGALGILCMIIARNFHILLSNDKKVITLLNLTYLIFLPSLAFLIFNLSKIFFGIILVFWLSYICILICTNKDLIIKIEKIKKSQAILLWISAVFLLTSMAFLVPPTLSHPGGSVVNILSHLLGFLIGFFTMFYIFAKSLNKSYKI